MSHVKEVGAGVEASRSCAGASPVLIVGGSPERSSAEVLLRAAAGCRAIVAVDRGLDALLAANLTCDLFCGDADSVSEAGAGLVREAEEAGRDGGEAAFAVVRYNPHKDDTDLGLAISEVAARYPGAPFTSRAFPAATQITPLQSLAALRPGPMRRMARRRF